MPENSIKIDKENNTPSNALDKLPSSIDLKADLALLKDAVKDAGKIALDYFKTDQEIKYKGKSRSPVSEGDFAVDGFLREYLGNARPEYAWLSEETEDDLTRLDQDICFVVDPIDGTRAYIAGEDGWCISIAIVYQKQPIVGVLYAPALDKLFAASYKNGAFLNQAPIERHAAKMAKHTIRAIIPDEFNRIIKADYKKSVDQIAGSRSLALRLMALAEGQVDAIFVRKNSSDWDLAAADLIIQETGFTLVEKNGEKLQYNGPTTAHGLLFASASSYTSTMIDGLK